MAYRNKRPAPDPIKHSTGSSESSQESAKRLKAPVFDSRSKIFTTKDKLDEGQKLLLDDIVRSHGGRLAAQAQNADIIVTRIDAPKRLLRSLPDDSLWPTKTIVSPEWIDASIDQGRQVSTADYRKTFQHRTADTSSTFPESNEGLSPISGLPFGVLPRAKSTDADRKVTTLTLEELRAKFVVSNLACQRWSPLVCVNDALVKELDIVKRGRKSLDGNEMSALSYSRAISALKAYPWSIDETTDFAQLQTQLKGAGGKVVKLIELFVKTGSIPDADFYRQNGALHKLAELQTIHGVGAKTARKLLIEGLELSTVTEFNTEHVEDFNKPIPRIEVEEIGLLVAEYLHKVQPDCEYCITGGYRRGKPMSNDIDIVISHRTPGKEKHVLEQLVAALTKDGILIRNIYTTNSGTTRPPGAQNFHASQMDPLDKTFCVFLPPKRSSLQRIHRRVDLIVAPWIYYFTAIVGWSGSTQFERDIRRWCEKQDKKFDSGGLTHRSTSEDIPVMSEEHLFEILGLQYIPPNYRCADALRMTEASTSTLACHEQKTTELPVELLLQIFEVLSKLPTWSSFWYYTDRERQTDLSSFALVNQAWKVAAMRRLYSRVWLKNTGRLSLLVDTLQRRPDLAELCNSVLYPGEVYDLFLQLLLLTRPSFISCRGITLLLVRPDLPASLLLDARHLDLQGRGHDIQTEKDLPSLLLTMRRLERLDLKNFSANKWSPTGFSPASLEQPSLGLFQCQLRHFRLYQCQFSDAWLQGLLPMLTALRSLEIKGSSGTDMILRNLRTKKLDRLEIVLDSVLGASSASTGEFEMPLVTDLTIGVTSLLADETTMRPFTKWGYTAELRRLEIVSRPLSGMSRPFLSLFGSVFLLEWETTDTFHDLESLTLVGSNSSEPLVHQLRRKCSEMGVQFTCLPKVGVAD